jgi:hypothetical protein
VASQPNVITNSLGLPASISVSRLGVLLNTGQAFQVLASTEPAASLAQASMQDKQPPPNSRHEEGLKRFRILPQINSMVMTSTYRSHLDVRIIARRSGSTVGTTTVCRHALRPSTRTLGSTPCGRAAF